MTEAAEASWDDGEKAAQRTEGEEALSQKDLQQYLDEQMQRVKNANNTTREEILAAILVVMLLSENEDKASISAQHLERFLLN